MRHFGRFAIPFLIAGAASGQIIPYGPSTPAAFTAVFDSGGQVPTIGNPTFNLEVRGWPNNAGGALGIALAPASLVFGPVTLLLDPSTLEIIVFPPFQTVIPLGLPSLPSLVGASANAQFGLTDPSFPGGFGLTNAVTLTILPDRTPTRAWFGGQDFSNGAVAPGQMASLDLTAVPPAFRATGSIGYAGNISFNFTSKVAVAEGAGIAYTHGNDTTNQFIRAFNVGSDPAGLVTWPVIGDIPLALPTLSSVGKRDLEVTPDNALLFATNGSSGNVTLDVYDVTALPASVPSTPIQTVSFVNAGGGPAILDLSLDASNLAVLIANDFFPTISLYGVSIGAPQPLIPRATLSFAGYAGSSYPNDVHFSPDGTLLFITGGNGFFSVVDVTGLTPVTLISSGSWSTTQSSSDHGSAVAIQNGTLVGIVADAATTGSPLYRLIDLNRTSSAFGTVVGSFTTNLNGNISSHRMHARQNIVVATDGTGATNDCQWVDVIDLNQPTVSGYQSWRVKMPSTFSLTPPGLSCIPRDFDIY